MHSIHLVAACSVSLYGDNQCLGWRPIQDGKPQPYTWMTYKQVLYLPRVLHRTRLHQTSYRLTPELQFGKCKVLRDASPRTACCNSVRDHTSHCQATFSAACTIGRCQAVCCCDQRVGCI